MFTRILYKHGHEDGQSVHVSKVIVTDTPVHGHYNEWSVHSKQLTKPYTFKSGHIDRQLIESCLSSYFIEQYGH